MKESDVSILDTSFIEKGEISHMGLVDMEELQEKYPNKIIIPTHMHDDTKEVALKLRTDKFVVLNDGDEYNF